MRTVQKLMLVDARAMMAGAEAKAIEIGVDMDIAITDDNGSLLLFQRMDGGRITSIDVAISKAFTAAAARKSPRDYGVAGAATLTPTDATADGRRGRRTGDRPRQCAELEASRS